MTFISVENTRLKIEITTIIVVKWPSRAKNPAENGVIEMMIVTATRNKMACQKPCLEFSKSAALRSKPPIQMLAAITSKISKESQLTYGISQLICPKDC